MSSLGDARSPRRFSRENEGQGIQNRDQPVQFGIASRGNSFFYPNPNPNLNRNPNPYSNFGTNKNSSAPPSFSSASSSDNSVGGRSFFPVYNSSSSLSSAENAAFNKPAFLGSKESAPIQGKCFMSEPSSSMARGFCGNNATANINPFTPTSTSSVIYTSPRKSTPMCDVGTTFHKQTGSVSASRPRLVKVRRNASSVSAKGKSAVSSNLFSGRDCKNSLDDDISGFNPFRSGYRNQFGSCFANHNSNSSLNENNQSSFRSCFGENVGNHGLKPRQDSDGLKSNVLNNSAKKNEVLVNDLSSWKPFTESSEVKITTGVSSNNSYFNNFENGRFKFVAGSDNSEVPVKEKSENEAGEGSVFGFPVNFGCGSTLNKVNHDGSSGVDDEQQAFKANEINFSVADVTLPSSQAFGFDEILKSKPRIVPRRRQNLHSSARGGSAVGSRSGSTFKGLKCSGQSGFENSSASRSSSYTFGNQFVSPAPFSGSESSGSCNRNYSFVAQKPLSGLNVTNSAMNGSLGVTTDGPIPSTFTFNAGEKIESMSKEIPKSTPLVKPFLFSARSASAFSAPQSPCGSLKETVNKDASNTSNSSGEMGDVPSGLKTSQSGTSSPKKDSSWPFMESLSSSLNGIFEFSANKGAKNNYSAKKKSEKNQFHASVRHKVGKQSALKSRRDMPNSFQTNTADRGSPMDFSPYDETAVRDEVLAGYDNMPGLGQSSAAWATAVNCGVQAKHDLHVFFVMEAKVDELSAAAANLHIGTDKDRSSKIFYQEESFKGEEHQSWHTSSRTDESEHDIHNTGGKGKTSSVSSRETEQLVSRMERVRIEEESSIPSSETELLTSRMEKVRIEEQTSIPSSEAEWLNSRLEKVRIADPENNNDGPENEGSYQSKKFTFVASSPTNSTSSSKWRRSARRSFRPKVGENIRESSSEINFDMPHFAAQNFNERERIQGRTSNPRGDESQNTVQKGEDEIKGMGIPGILFDQPAILERFSFPRKPNEETGAVVSSRAVKSAAAEQACEKWRLRGNQAYASGDFPKAEDCYSRGASSVSPSETSESCIRASMLCYSNRAATRMAVGRMREALSDCMRAMAINPNFLRVKIRAASCHLSLGETDAAISLFKGCLSLAQEVGSLDLKIASEASEGLKKAQKGWEFTNRAAELLDTRNPGDATNALRMLNEALSVSQHSEHLLELKARALFSLRKYEEVIQVCEQSLDSAERNYSSTNNDCQLGNEESLGSLAMFPIKLWRWRMSSKAYFYLGRLEGALDLLLKYEELNSVVEGSGRHNQESLTSFTSTVCDLLRHKAAGNKAFQSGKHSEAVEHYTAALTCNGESWPFTAVCFCNRAAAAQALGHIADAIADCSRAIALDANYRKAISRRATLHEMVRDYGQASNDLHRLITLLERQQGGKGSLFLGLGSSSNGTQDLRQARDRLAKTAEEMKREHPLDHYLILGVESSSTGAEIKKAYRKAALRHHPDKAGQFLVRSDGGDDSLWREVGEEARRDAERLFKMIGESYAILSDSSKRLRYDTEEELRKLRTRGSSSGSETVSEGYRYQSEKGTRRQRDCWDSWNGHTNQYQRWQNGPDAAQPDTYARRASNSTRSSDGTRGDDWEFM